MPAIAINYPVTYSTFSKSTPLFIECARSLCRRLGHHRNSSVLNSREHSITVATAHWTIAVLTEISRSKCEDAALAFLYLEYTLLEPNFCNFHNIVRSSEVAVMAASRRKRIPQLDCAQVNLIPRVIEGWQYTTFPCFGGNTVYSDIQTPDQL